MRVISKTIYKHIVGLLASNLSPCVLQSSPVCYIGVLYLDGVW